jgi:hypothetical protein
VISQLDAKKLWIKLIFEKKRGGFTRLMEAMSAFGFVLIDTSVTTTKGAMLVSSSVEVSKNKHKGATFHIILK